MCLCRCSTRIIVLFYLHSKVLIKVSGLTQQPLVNLAAFSHSPTHDLSIFLYCTVLHPDMFLQRRDVQFLKSLNQEDFLKCIFMLCASILLVCYFFLGGVRGVGGRGGCLSIRRMCDYKLAVFDSCAKTVRSNWWGDCVCVGVIPKPQLFHQLLSISYTRTVYVFSIYTLKKFPVQLVTRKKKLLLYKKHRMKRDILCNASSRKPRKLVNKLLYYYCQNVLMC